MLSVYGQVVSVVNLSYACNCKSSPFPTSPGAGESLALVEQGHIPRGAILLVS